MNDDCIELINERIAIIKGIKNKYIDIPRILHENKENGTSSDLVIDEIIIKGIELERSRVKTIIEEIDTQLDKSINHLSEEHYKAGKAIIKDIKRELGVK